MSTTMTWIAQAPCGCIRAAQVDDGKGRHALQRRLGEWVHKGYRVSQLPTETVRTMHWRCTAETCPFKTSVGGQLFT